MISRVRRISTLAVFPVDLLKKQTLRGRNMPSGAIISSYGSNLFAESLLNCGINYPGDSKHFYTTSLNASSVKFMMHSSCQSCSKSTY